MKRRERRKGRSEDRWRGGGSGKKNVNSLSSHFLSLPQQENPFASARRSEPSKLPQDRSPHDEEELDPSAATKGYLTVRQVMEIFDRRAADSEKWTADAVAAQYCIDPTDAANLIRYYNNYKISVSKEGETRPRLDFHLLHR